MTEEGVNLNIRPHPQIWGVVLFIDGSKSAPEWIQGQQIAVKVFKHLSFTLVCLKMFTLHLIS